MAGPGTGRAAGVLFPRDGSGARGSLDAGRRAFADAARGVDGALAVAIENDARWRSGYPAHLLSMEAAALQATEAPVRMAMDGLASVHRRFEFARRGETLALTEAMDSPAPDGFDTAGIDGTAPFRAPRLVVPWRGQHLHGEALRERLAHWREDGIVEPSHVRAIERVLDNPDWLDLRDTRVVLMGAGAEIGPLDPLADWGACIIALELPRPDLWRRLATRIRGSSARLRFPVRTRLRPGTTEEDRIDGAGADLLTEAPEIARWLAAREGPLTLGAYAYLDGRDHVRVAVAMDAIQANLTRRRDDVALAFLATPTDAFAVGADCVAEARGRFARESSGPWRRAVNRLSGRRLYVANLEQEATAVGGERYGLFDGLVTLQGPNYAFAKRIQKWRALLARSQGVRVSANVAPPCFTRSVVHNRAFAAAYRGARHYGAEIFAPATANALMAALLVHDLRQSGCAADPTAPLGHPLDLFIEGANHGGLWRGALQARSVLGIAALRGLLTRA